MKKNFLKTLVAIAVMMTMMTIPVSATVNDDYMVSPCYNHTESIALTISFDKNNVVYCSLAVNLFATGTGTSGIMTLYDSNGAILQRWPVSDYEQPISADFTYPGVYGERYTLTYSGYVYGTGMIAPDWVDMSITDTCVDVY